MSDVRGPENLQPLTFNLQPILLQPSTFNPFQLRISRITRKEAVLSPSTRRSPRENRGIVNPEMRQDDRIAECRAQSGGAGRTRSL